MNKTSLPQAKKLDLISKLKLNKTKPVIEQNDENFILKDKKIQVQSLLQSKAKLSDTKKSHHNIKNSVVHKVTQELENIIFHENNNCFMLGDSERVRVDVKHDEVRFQAINSKLLPIDFEIVIKALQASN